MNFDISKFKELGYVLVKDFLPEDELQNILKVSQKHYEYSLTLQYDQGHYRLNSPTNLNKIEGACNFEPEFLKLARNNKLLSIGKHLINAKDTLDVYISKFFPMKPKVGISTYMHQDNYYFRKDPATAVSCVIYLQDTNKENGCLRVVLKSHGKGIFNHNIASHIPGIHWIDEKDIKLNYEILDLELQAPYAVFFDIDLIHGCYNNTSDSTRFSLAWEYIETNDRQVMMVNDVWCDRNLAG